LCIENEQNQNKTKQRNKRKIKEFSSHAGCSQVKGKYQENFHSASFFVLSCEQTKKRKEITNKIAKKSQIENETQNKQTNKQTNKQEKERNRKRNVQNKTNKQQIQAKQNKRSNHMSLFSQQRKPIKTKQNKAN
jgi:hypothetical protein